MTLAPPLLETRVCIVFIKKIKQNTVIAPKNAKKILKKTIFKTIFYISTVTTGFLFYYFSVFVMRFILQLMNTVEKIRQHVHGH